MDAFLSMLALLCCSPLLYVIIVGIECDIIEWKYRRKIKQNGQKKRSFTVPIEQIQSGKIT